MCAAIWAPWLRPPPRIWAHIRGRYWSGKKNPLSVTIDLRVDPDSCDENLAAALHDVGAGEDHGVHRRPLLHLVRLTRQAALVNLPEINTAHVRDRNRRGDVFICLVL
jgi:hypothetical protein